LKILVTGAGGMLGRELARVFSKSNSTEVIGITRNECDLTDHDSTLKLFNDVSPDLIIHSAALVGGIAANISYPFEFLSKNLAIDGSVINAAVDLRIEKLIYIGSSCMYPKNFRQPLKESDLLAAPLEPTNEGYALAKLAGSKLASYAAKEFGLCYRTIIPSNLYGPGDNFLLESSHLVAAAIKKVHEAKVNKESHIEVWGTGKARREFTYISDVAYWLADNLGNICKFPDVMNLGYGSDYTIDEYYEAAQQVVGTDLPLMHDLSKPEGMMQKLMDSSVAKSKYNWNPSTSILDGMKLTYENFLKAERAK